MGKYILLVVGDFMRVYLDNCCFNRPFDEQTSVIIRLETDAKLYVQELIRSGQLELCWSFVLDYENAANPFEEVRGQIAEWKKLAVADCMLTEKISKDSASFMALGLRQMDAAHIACAAHLGADCFLTTDKKILNKPITEIQILNPIDFIRRYTDAE
jgi:predicted nucleic acid-binding protein